MSAKAGWTRVAFGDVVRLARERSSDPGGDGFERYVGLDHIEPGDLRIRRWGNVTDGTTFTNVFRAGHLLFGKRRAYQRKVAVAEFDGVCSGDIYVFEPRNDQLLPELLPFICQTDQFFEYAVGTSAGSLSPRTNWSSLSQYEFALPSLEEQRRIIKLYSATLEASSTNSDAAFAAATLYRSMGAEILRPKSDWPSLPLSDLTDPAAPICYGIVKLGTPVSRGVPVLRTQNLNGDYAKDLYFCTESVDHAFRRSRVRAGDVLVAIQGMSTGKIGVVPARFEGNINRHLARVRLGPRMRSDFFIHLWRSPQFHAYTTRQSAGSTKPELTIGALKAIRVPCPPLAEQEAIAGVLSRVEHAEDEFQSRARTTRTLTRSLTDE